jgi:hypothetical protein
MNKLLGVFNSDAVNLDGSRTTAGALVSALYDNFEIGIPNLVSHDFSRPIGWSRPVAIHIEPGVTRLFGLSEIAEKEDEAKEIFQSLNAFLSMELGKHRSEVETLRKMLSPHLRGKEKALCLGGVAFIETGLVARLAPKLISQQDKDGLIPLELLTPTGPGAFQIGDFVIFAHPFFRRSCSRLNSLNSPFFLQIQKMAKSGIPVNIALDSDMVGIASAYRPRVELEYWWGPKFTDDLASIPVGVTHHEANEIERISHGIKATEFWWQSRGGQHILEAEELRDIPSTFEEGDQYTFRYVHAIVQEASGQLLHFDGAVRSYTKEQMVKRLELNISDSDRKTKYTKLWRLDNPLPISDWKSLLSNYFRDNHLVAEYLGATPEKPNVPNINDDDKKLIPPVLSSFVPYSMSAGAGVRISISYHIVPGGEHKSRKMVSLDKLVSLNGEIEIIESCALELRKAFERLGIAVPDTPEIRYLNCKDFYSNLPLIVHGNTILPEELDKTLSAIKLLIGAWKEEGYNRVVGYSIEFPAGQKQVLVSVLGHVNDLYDWLSNPLYKPPVSQDELVEWADHVSEFVTKRWAVARDQPHLFETLMTSGVLLAKRKLIEHDKLKLNGVDTNGALECELIIPDNEGELAKSVEAKEIAPAPALFILESKCSKCGKDYKECGHSKLLDKDVTEDISNLEPVFFFWTDRPLWPWVIENHLHSDGYHHFAGKIYTQ